jgi:uncharacterized protein (DUF1697 family)
MTGDVTRWAMFLRGINVGGHRKIPMAALRALVADVTGDPGVKSYIASGNVVFAADRPETDLRTTLRSRIADAFGFDVPVLLQNAAQMRAVLAACPCPEEKGNLAFAYLCFDDPVIDAAGINALRVASENVTVNGRTVWLHAPDGVGRSKLGAKMEQLIGVKATARNLNTVRKMVEMLDG